MNTKKAIDEKINLLLNLRDLYKHSDKPNYSRIMNDCIEAIEHGEKNEKLLKKITFIAGFNITVDSEREEVITMLQEYVKNMKVKRILIRTDGKKINVP